MKFKRSCLNRFLIAKEIKKYWWVSILQMAVLAVVALYPMMSRRNYGFITEKIRGIALVLMVISVVTASIIFGYLYKKNSSEFMFSLPVGKMEMYWSKFVSGLILSVTVTTVVYMIFVNMVRFNGVGHITSGINFGVTYLILIGVQVLSYATGVCAATVTSNHFTASGLALIFIVLPFGMVEIICQYINTWLFGSDLVVAHFNGFLELVELINPLVVLTYRQMDTTLTGVGVRLTQGGVGFIIKILVCFILYMILGSFLYGRRKEEESGSMITFKCLKPVMRYGITICCVLTISAFMNHSYIGNDGFKWLLIYMLSTMIVFIIVTRFIGKSNNYLFKGAGVAGLICLVSFVLWQDVLGIANKQISLEEGEFLTFSISREERNKSFYGFVDEKSLQENLNDLIGLIYDTRNNSRGVSNEDRISISVSDSTGEIKESYLFNYNHVNTKDFSWEGIYTSNEFRMKDIEHIKSYKDINCISLFKGMVSFGGEEKSHDVKDEKLIKEFFEALRKDRMEMTYEELMDDRVVGRVNIVYTSLSEYSRTSIVITESYENTLRVLSNAGILNKLQMRAEDVNEIIINPGMKNRVKLLSKEDIESMLAIINPYVYKYRYGRYQTINRARVVVIDNRGENRYNIEIEEELLDSFIK